MAYTKKTWEDFPSENTPITANDLNNIEDGIEALDTDMNNIKSFLLSGWNLIEGVTFTFSSWDSTVSTLVVATNYDLTPYVGLGNKLKYTHNSATKYAIVTAITSTTMTLYLGTDYTVSSGNITNVYFSKMKAPFGFPLNGNKWSISTIISTDQEQSDPVNGTWYNVGGIQLIVPIGSWKVSVGSTYVAVRNEANIIDNWVKSTLSTSNNSESDIEFTKAIYQQAPTTGSVTAFGATYVEKELMLTTPTTYYFNLSTIRNNNTIIRVNAGVSPTIIKAVCAYL